VAQKETVKDPQQQQQQQQQFFLQFCTTRQTPAGEMRMRVTTLTRAWTDGTNTQHITAGFDQECAAVVLARLATHKMEFEEEFDAMRWIDRKLINLSKRFGEYRKDDSQSFQLAPSMSIFPQFVFNLRRSQFIQVCPVPLPAKHVGPSDDTDLPPFRSGLPLLACQRSFTECVVR